jgi:hypothetical protein
MSYEEKIKMDAQDIENAMVAGMWARADEEAAYNDACEQVLVKADKRGLQLEVVIAAFKHKTQFPDAPILQCLQVGADEWDV